MELLFTDRDLVICVKPVGLDSEIGVPEALIAQLGGEIYPIHRLDQQVGGVMVCARTKKAAAELSRSVQEGSMIKEYQALVHGTPPEDGVWEDLLWKDSRQNKVFVVKRMRKGVRDAKLSFTRLSAGETSLVHIRLYTGRSHQIRVQFASRGFPLVGDHRYGARDDDPAPLLYACRITFPWKGQVKVFEHYPQWGQKNTPGCP